MRLYVECPVYELAHGQRDHLGISAAGHPGKEMVLQDHEAEFSDDADIRLRYPAAESSEIIPLVDMKRLDAVEIYRSDYRIARRPQPALQRRQAHGRNERRPEWRKDQKNLRAPVKPVASGWKQARGGL